MANPGGAEGALFERFGRVFAAGTVIFSEGDLGAQMFVVQSGVVQLTRRLQGQDALLDTLGPGEFFGEMAIVNNKPRSATAIAVDECALLCIDAKTFEAMVRGNAEIAVRLIKKLAARLEQANGEVETMLRKELSHRVVHHLRRLADGGTQTEPVTLPVTALDIALALQAPFDEVETCLAQMAQAKLLVVGQNGLDIPLLDDLDRVMEAAAGPATLPGVA